MVSGVLDPDEKVNLEITFSPNEARDFSAKLYIRCQQSPSVRTLQVRGHGENMKLSFDPPTLEFSPVQPFHKADTFFFLENRSSVDVEVYSVDFDRQVRKTACTKNMGSCILEQETKTLIRLLRPAIHSELPHRMLFESRVLLTACHGAGTARWVGVAS